jgi:hypothetical protein
VVANGARFSFFLSSHPHKKNMVFPRRDEPVPQKKNRPGILVVVLNIRFLRGRMIVNA